MAIYTGLNINNYLSDVENKSASLRNLGLDRRDFDHIRGLNTFITRSQFHMLAGMDTDYEKEQYSLYRSAQSVAADLKNVNDLTEGLAFDLRLNNQLRAGAIKYKYITYSFANPGFTTNLKSADISTSRVSSWSQFVPNGPIFYGADVNVIGDGSETIVQLEDIVFTGPVTPKRFEAEVPTDKITVKVNDKDRELYTMRNIPVKFDGYFRTGTITYKIDTSSGILPTVNFIDLPAYPQGIPQDGIRGLAENTATYSRSTTPSDKTIELYFAPSGIEELTLSPINMTSLPNVVFPNLEKVNFAGNLLPAMPDFFNMSGGNIATGPVSWSFGTRFKSVIMNGNPLYKETQNDPTKTANTQLNDRLTKSLEALEINACFSDDASIDISSLKAGAGSVNLEDSQLKKFIFDGQGPQSTVARMTDTTVTPRVNPAKIQNYAVRHQKYTTLSNSITQAPDLRTLDLYSTPISSGQAGTAANGASGTTITLASSEIRTINADHTDFPIINVANKTKLESYSHNSVGGDANPSGGIDGFFTGCIALKDINFENSYVSGTVSTLFQNLPALTSANFKNTRLTGRMSSGSFVGTTSLATFRSTGGLFTSEAGTVSNFFGNSFVEVPNPTPGEVGTVFEGGYYAGKMLGDSSEEYYLVVCDKVHEVYKSRYKITGSDTTPHQGSDDVKTGLDNTTTEYGADSDYDAAKYAIDLTANVALSTGFDDWYIPAENELELLYRTFKPSNTTNDTNSGTNPHSVPSYNVTYSNDGQTPLNPVRTSISYFQAGGSQAFESTGPTDQVVNPVFAAGNTSWQNFGGATNSVFAPGLLKVIQDTAGTGSDGSANTVADGIIGNAGIYQTLTLPAGTYDVEFDINSASRQTLGRSDLVVDQRYEIQNLGSYPVKSANAQNISIVNDTLTIPSHGYVANAIVAVSRTGGGEDSTIGDGDYYVIVEDANTIKLAGSAGGSALDINIDYDTYDVDITSASGSNHYVISGTDSGGSVSGNDAGITLDVGDTLNLDNAVHGGHPVEIRSSISLVETIGDVSGGDVDATSNEFTISGGHSFENGDAVSVSLIGNYLDLNSGTTYYIANKTSTTFKLQTVDSVEVQLDATNISNATNVSVTFTRSGVQHTTGVTGAGTSSIVFTPTAAGTYYYQCVNHANMFGTITVSNKGSLKTLNLTYNVQENWKQVSGLGGTITAGSTDFIMNTARATTTTNGATLPANLQVTLHSTDPSQENFVYGSVTQGSDPKAGIDLSTFTYEISNGAVTSVNPKITLSAQTDVHIKVESYSADFVVNKANIRSRDGYYWSSTQSLADDGQGIGQSFVSGEQIDVTKTDMYYVRPVRRVNINSGTSAEVEFSSSVFEPVKGSLTTFGLKGQGRDTGLPESNIRGKMPDVSFLEEISTFEITDTQLTGLIPTFNQSSKLNELNLASNKFTGSYSINNSNVAKIYVSNNELSGISTLNAPNMWLFDASYNNLIGGVPSFQLCSDIQQINLSYNNLQGYTVGTLDTNIELKKLNLQNNDLSEGAARRLFEDMLDNYNNGNTNKVNLNLRANPQVKESNLLGYAETRSAINKLRSEGWTLSMNT